MEYRRTLIRNLKRRRGNSSSSFNSSSQSSLLAINDKISTLPDHILHDIFKLLPTECIARTSILSKRFDDLFLKCPVMDLNEFDHRTETLLHRMHKCYETHDFKFLEKLKIHARKPDDDKFVSKLLDGCPQLEKFSFKFNLPGKKIQFFHSRIKHLVVGCYDSKPILEIVAPNLQIFKFTGPCWKNNYYYNTNNNGLMIYMPQNHTILAPNLEKLYVEHVFLDDDGIKLALSAFKNL